MKVDARAVLRRGPSVTIVCAVRRKELLAHRPDGGGIDAVDLGEHRVQRLKRLAIELDVDAARYMRAVTLSSESVTCPLS